MRKRRLQQLAWLGCVLLGLSVTPLTARAQTAPAGREIAQKARDAMRLDGSEGVSTLTIRNARGQERVRKVAQVSKTFDNGETEKRLLRFVAPADIKGTGLLTYDYESKDDDVWLFLGASRKTRRIISSEKSRSFMGSEFSYSDITPPSLDDFEYKVTGSESIDGEDCWILESRPKSDKVRDENGYSRRTGYIGKKDFVVRKAVYYDENGELWKELTAKDVREIDPDKHRYRAMEMTMVNKQNGRVSIMKVEDLRLRKDIPDDYFTTRYLERP